MFVVEQTTVTTPRSQVNTDLRRHGMSPSSIAREIHTQLVYGDVISSEIATANAEERNRKEGIRNLISGKILKKLDNQFVVNTLK